MDDEYLTKCHAESGLPFYSPSSTLFHYKWSSHILNNMAKMSEQNENPLFTRDDDLRSQLFLFVIQAITLYKSIWSPYPKRSWKLLHYWLLLDVVLPFYTPFSWHVLGLQENQQQLSKHSRATRTKQNGEQNIYRFLVRHNIPRSLKGPLALSPSRMLAEPGLSP